VSDSFDGDPDDVFEPDEPETEYGEHQFDVSDPAVSYEEGTLDTAPSVPEAPSPADPSEVDYSDIDPELRQLFWKLVLVVKVALISLTLGTLFLTLGDSPRLGTQLLAFGAILISYGVYQYRKSKTRIDSDEFDPIRADGDTEETDADEPATPPGPDAPEYPTGDDS